MLCNVSKHQRNGALFAELHSITQQQSSPTNNMRLCNVSKISVMKRLFAELHSITQQQGMPTNNMRLCNVVNISVMKLRDVLSERGKASRLSE